MIIPKYFEDNHIFGVNDEPMRAYYIPTSPAQDPDWMMPHGNGSFLITERRLEIPLFRQHL